MCYRTIYRYPELGESVCRPFQHQGSLICILLLLGVDEIYQPQTLLSVDTEVYSEASRDDEMFVTQAPRFHFPYCHTE